MTVKEIIIKQVCEAVGAPSEHVYDVSIRYNGEVRIGYMRDKFSGVTYRWFREWVKP